MAPPAALSCTAGPKERALARLAGLNVQWALDVAGNGTIDPVVLARSLKRFDSTVFDDESVGALLEVLGGGNANGEGSGAPVRVQQLSDMIASAPTATPRLTPRAPLVPRSPACSRHAAVLEDYMDGLVCDLDDFRASVHPEDIVAAAGDSPEELEALKNRLKEKAKQFMLDTQRKNISPVWDAFDRDRDGALSLDECSRLVQAYLKAFGPKAGEAVRSAVELGVELNAILFEKRVSDPVRRRKFRELAARQVDAVHAKVAPLVQETLQRIAGEDPSVIATELLADLDANHDGKVTREEFEERFHEAMQQVLGPERLMDKLQRAPSQR
eukprot:TRINITY_DN798_c0_g2_i2.p1 TRINITY_DN798_c0_g2~~TRINITY_DN798_c0_g2_i2.p1  ORF type:complete len:328 (-),score=78.36 TRINITY_DN798_c0_g2_i2:392-1375(-)